MIIRCPRTILERPLDSIGKLSRMLSQDTGFAQTKGPAISAAEGGVGFDGGPLEPYNLLLEALPTA